MRIKLTPEEKRRKRIRKAVQLYKERVEQFREFQQRAKLFIARHELHKAGKIPPLLLTSYIGKYEVRAGCLGKQQELDFR